MLRQFTLAAGLASFTAPAAFGQSVSAGVPDTVVTALRDLGHNATATTDSYGDPMIEANYGDLKYSVLFYGCEENENCQDLQFRASFERDDNSANDAAVYGFNGEWMVGKTYVSQSGDALIEHPIMGVDGLSRASFERMLGRWVSAMEDFYDLLYES